MVMKINLEVSAIVTENDNHYIIPTSQTRWSYIKSMEVKYMDYYEILGSSLFKRHLNLFHRYLAIIHLMYWMGIYNSICGGHRKIL